MTEFADGHRIALSMKFREPEGPRLSAEEAMERFAEVFADIPVTHIGPTDPNMPLGQALLVTQLQIEAMKEPWGRAGYCGEIDKPYTEQDPAEAVRPYVEHMMRLNGPRTEVLGP